MENLQQEPESVLIRKQEKALLTLRVIAETLRREDKISQGTFDGLIQCANIFCPKEDGNRRFLEIIAGGPKEFALSFGNGAGEVRHYVSVSSKTLTAAEWPAKIG